MCPDAVRSQCIIENKLLRNPAMPGVVFSIIGSSTGGRDFAYSLFFQVFFTRDVCIDTGQGNMPFFILRLFGFCAFYRGLELEYCGVVSGHLTCELGSEILNLHHHRLNYIQDHYKPLLQPIADPLNLLHPYIHPTSIALHG
jgi:hypothetical protein